MKNNIVVIASIFHEKDVTLMREKVRQTAKQVGFSIEEVLVPGCYEIPLTLKRELLKKDIDGAVVLGIIEKGETKHGLVMGFVVHQAIVTLELETGKPVGKCILGPDIVPSQMKKRLIPYARDAVLAVSKMLNLEKNDEESMV